MVTPGAMLSLRNNSQKRIVQSRASIEQQLPEAPETEDIYTIGDLAGEILQAIYDGWIVDYPPKDQDKYLSPTMADGLSEEDRSEAWRLLCAGEKLVTKFAKITGWRSPIGLADHREWKHWRANSSEEMAFIMRAVLRWEDRQQ